MYIRLQMRTIYEIVRISTFLLCLKIFMKLVEVRARIPHRRQSPRNLANYKFLSLCMLARSADSCFNQLRDSELNINFRINNLALIPPSSHFVIYIRINLAVFDTMSKLFQIKMDYYNRITAINSLSLIAAFSTQYRS